MNQPERSLNPEDYPAIDTSGAANAQDFDIDYLCEALSEELYETALVPSSNGLALQKLLMAYLDPDMDEKGRIDITAKVGEITCNMVERYVDLSRRHRIKIRFPVLPVTNTVKPVRKL